MKPWGALPGYGDVPGECLLMYAGKDGHTPWARMILGQATWSKAWLRSVRLPEPHLGLERYYDDTLFQCMYGYGNADRMLAGRAAYFAARLTGLDDEQAARQAWAKWRGEED